MNFELISPEEFRVFADRSPYKSFYQTPEIAHLREKSGWTTYYFGAKKGKKLLAAAMVVAKPAFLGKSVFYCPGGPLLDYENRELTKFFFKSLKKYARSHNGYVLHIEPYYELIERDRDGVPKENGFDRTKAEQNLRELGFRPCKTSDEPKYAFVIDINNRTPDELLAAMKRNTRNHIRKAEKMGVKIRELEREELPIFKQITESTSRRRDFSDKPLTYYETMYDLFHDRGEVKFMLAEGPVDALLRSIFGDGPNTERPRPITTGSRERSEKDVSMAPTSASRAPSTLQNDFSAPTPLSAAMFMTYGSEIIYLFSGSDEKYMKDYNAQYLIQWHMLKYAAKNGYRRYNFYGINGLPDKTSKDYGIYDFKKGFGGDSGRVTELLGAHELPLNAPFYHLHELLKKLKP